MEKTKKIARIGNVVLIILAMACLVYYDVRGGLWLKGVTSGWFVLLGTWNLLYAGRRGCRNFRFLLLIELELILTMTADVMLGIHFMTGTVLFALGHVSCCAAFCVLEKFRRRDLILILLVSGVSLFLVLGLPYIQVEDPVMQAVLVVYAIVISCMLGKGLGNLLAKKSPARWLMAIGGCLFWFSDLMLALNLFGSGGRTASLLCMYTYWPGQSILAHSLYHAVNENCE